MMKYVGIKTVCKIEDDSIKLCEDFKTQMEIDKKND